MQSTLLQVGFPVRCLLALLLALPTLSTAHIGLHEAIDLTTRQISSNPRDATLYLQRAELYREHRMWDEALADYRKAGKLDANLWSAELGMAQLYLDQGNPRVAAEHISTFLEHAPGHIRGLATRAEVRNQLGQHLQAAADYNLIITRLENDPGILPEYYHQRARQLLAAGSQYADQALLGLDEGISRLGAVPALELLAIEIETSAQRYDDALTRINGAINRSARKENWLARRGNTLLLACRLPEARKAYIDALSAMDQLNHSRRNTPAMLALRSSLETGLEKAATQECISPPG